ncbi:MAG: pentapeptide repeat-containing protein [Ilumatobacteraceae bacterium]
MGCAWLLSSPPGTAPDDSFHFSNVWCPEGVNGIKCEESSDGDRMVPNSFVETSPWWKVSGALPGPPAMPHYPDLQYSVMRLFASDDVYQSVVLMRFVNLLLALFMISTSFLLVGKEGRFSVLLTWLITPMAYGFFLIASNHPMSWYLVGAGTLWTFIYGAIVSTSRNRRMWCLLFAVLAFVMTVGSRPEGQLVAVLVVVASSLVGFGSRDGLGSRLISRRVLTSRSGIVGLVGVPAAAVLGILLLGSQFTTGVYRDSLERMSNLRDLLDTPEVYFKAIANSVGSFEAPVTGINSVPAGLAVAACIGLGMKKMWRAKSLALLAVTAAMIVAPQLIVVDARGPVFSPSRYFVVFMLLFIGLMLLMPNGSPNPSLSRGEVVLIGGAATFAHSLSLHSVLGPNGAINRGDWEFNLNQNLKWWWSIGPSPMTIWIVGSVAFSAALFLVLREYGDHSTPWSRKWRTAVIGLSVASLVPVVVVLEGSFYRPPLSERPSVGLSRPVEWTLSMEVSRPREVVELSTETTFLVLRVINGQVERLKNGDSSFPISVGLFADTWSDIAAGTERARIVISSDQRVLNLEGTAWKGVRMVGMESGYSVLVPMWSSDDVGSLIKEIGKSSVRLEIEVDVPRCQPRESLLKCPFADFVGADLSRDDFERADLRGADFSDVNLSEAKLNGTDFSGALLDNADMSRAYMVGVDLSESSQQGVKFEGAIWTR